MALEAVTFQRLNNRFFHVSGCIYYPRYCGLYGVGLFPRCHRAVLTVWVYGPVLGQKALAVGGCAGDFHTSILQLATS